MTADEYLKSLPPDERQALEKCVEHSFTIMTFQGEVFCHPLRPENLFDEVWNKNHYVVDRNVPWAKIAAKPENLDKAFILGKTMSDEEPNTKALLFSPKVKSENNNLFVLGLIDLNQRRVIILERIDKEYRSVFDPKSLSASSSESGRKTDAKMVQWEYDRKRTIEHERRQVLDLLGVKTISDLPPPEHSVELMKKLVAFIKSNARRCLFNWELSAYVARHSYALLLAEHFPKIHEEIAEREYWNVFGDTQILKDALFLEAGILSGDKALARMGGYCGLECVTDV